MMSRVGVPCSFELGPEDLYKLAGIRVSAKEVERVSEMGAGRKKSFRQARQRRPCRTGWFWLSRDLGCLGARTAPACR